MLRIPTLGLKVFKQEVLWAVWSPRVLKARAQAALPLKMLSALGPTPSQSNPLGVPADRRGRDIEPFRLQGAASGSVDQG